MEQCYFSEKINVENWYFSWKNLFRMTLKWKHLWKNETLEEWYLSEKYQQKSVTFNEKHLLKSDSLVKNTCGRKILLVKLQLY